MDTWLDVARENRKAATVLSRGCHYRSAVSRAYYAAYARTTHALAGIGVTMPGGRVGPHHQSLPQMVKSNLGKPELSSILARLYVMRCLADYAPSKTVDSHECRAAVSLMLRVFESV